MFRTTCSIKLVFLYFSGYPIACRSIPRQASIISSRPLMTEFKIFKFDF